MANKALNEVKEFISMLFGTCIRFYNTLLVYQELTDMTEDIIAKLTTVLFHNKGMTELVLQLCNI